MVLNSKIMNVQLLTKTFSKPLSYKSLCFSKIRDNFRFTSLGATVVGRRVEEGLVTVLSVATSFCIAIMLYSSFKLKGDLVAGRSPSLRLSATKWTSNPLWLVGGRKLAEIS